MKTLKYALAAVLVSCMMISLASADGFTSKNKVTKKAVSISFAKALSNPGLVVAMYQQINPSFLNNNQHVYTQQVVYQGNIYMITGTYAQWYWFFYVKIPPPIDSNGGSNFKGKVE
ncbi:MAG: hypothetical protein K0B08_09165 [Bacteroidales bacterium]|nr:hypothetical protein [Bacteroidales bacterium]